MSYPFSRIFLGSLIRLYLGKITGKENLPKELPFIVACNHSSYIDDFILPYSMGLAVNRKFHIFVNSRFYKNPFFKIFLNHYDLIPVDVSKDVKDNNKKMETNEKAFGKALEYIKKGDLFMIFPEGGRSEDGKLKKAKTGVARVALSARVPVIPVGIKGTYNIMPKGAKFPKFKRAELVIGNPLYFDSFYGKEKDYKTLELVTKKIMKEIAKLTGQEYNY